MLSKGPAISPEALRKLMVIGQKQGAVSLSSLALEMGLSPEDTVSFLRQVFPQGSGVTVMAGPQETMVNIQANALQCILPLSPAEWIQFYQILSQVGASDSEDPVLQSLHKKVMENGPVKVLMELLSQLELWDHNLSEQQKTLVQIFDKAVTQKSLVNLETNEGKIYTVFPCRVIHLEGQLSIIAEDSTDHCLMVISINDVHGLFTIDSSKVAVTTIFEIEEFITAIRAMSEKETRLILKLHDAQSINLFPDYHFLGKPCMITNPTGELIWAAYVEPCEDLFDWLISLERKVEILDPVKFKDEYISYCEDKLKKSA